MTSPEINLAHSPASERNKEPILNILKEYIGQNSGSFLEIGHGTGQHAHHFSGSLEKINYMAADQRQYHPHYIQRMESLGCPDNLEGPFSFQVTDQEVRHNLSCDKYDYIYTANTLHIMSWNEAQNLLKKIPELLSASGLLFIYGPFKFSGDFTSASNAQFDLNLKDQNPQMGIRDFESIVELLKKLHIDLVKKIDMPANNFTLIFKKSNQD